MFKNQRRSPSLYLLAGLSALMMTTGVAAFQAVKELSHPHSESPPTMVATAVHQTLPALHSPLISLKYNDVLNSYRVRQLSHQNQLISYEQDADSGRLLALDTHLASKNQLPDGLISLETMLQKFFGKTVFQLLEVELITQQDQASYALDWIQEGARFHAHFNAMNGSMLSHTSV